MADQRTGDRVNLNPDDTNPVDPGQPIADLRLDLPDAAAIQEIAQETMVRMLGGLLGLGSGCLTIPTLTVVVAPAPAADVVVTMGSCLFHDAQSAGNNAVDGRVLRHVNGASNQTSFLDITTMQAAGILGVLWARRIELAMDQDVRKRWSTTAGAERSFAPNTRRRERVEFSMSSLNVAGYANPPVVGAGTEPWFPFARVTAWSGGGGAGSTPTVRAISVWDGWLNAGAYAGTGATPSSNVQSFVDGLGGGAVQLVPMLMWIRAQMALMVNTAVGANWNDSFPRGLVELDTDLAAEEVFSDGEAFAFLVYDGLAAANSYTVSATTGNKNIQSVNVVRTGVGVIQITSDISNVTYLDAVVHVTPGITGGASARRAVAGPTGVGAVVHLFDAAGNPADYDFHLSLRSSV